MDEVRCDFGHGQQYERSLGHAGVGQLEILSTEDVIAVEENVEVEGAGAGWAFELAEWGAVGGDGDGVPDGRDDLGRS